MAGSNYALRFISGKYQGGEFPLLPDREIFIGRGSELDMVLVEDMVSRKHARLSTKSGQVTIQDLGSTNGTFVNGEKIKKSRLKEGDRVLIGTSILKVITKDAGGATEQEAKKQLEGIGRNAKPESQRSAMTGSLEEVPVPDLLTLFSTSKRTGVLYINSHLGQAKVYLRNGNVFYALLDDDHELGPKKAFFRIVGWEEGQFEFTRPEEAENADFVLELEDPTDHLLMEGARQLDEMRRVSPELPDPRTHLSIPSPLQAQLSSLKPTELDVFQLVLNFSIQQQVFDKSPTTDFETATALLTLLNQGYVAKG